MRIDIEVKVPVTVGTITRQLAVEARVTPETASLTEVTVHPGNGQETSLAPDWLWQMVQEDFDQFGPIREAVEAKAARVFAVTHGVTITHLNTS